MATVNKLNLYNHALQLLGARQLSSDSENREPRYYLDTVYNLGAYDYCVELVKPTFALKTAKLGSPSTSSVHDLDQVYALPSDYVCLNERRHREEDQKPIAEVYSDAEMDEPIQRFFIENRNIACDITTNIYIRYVANDLDETFASWTPTFVQVFTAYLAKELAPRFAPQKLNELTELFAQRVAAAAQIETNKDPYRPVDELFTLTDTYRNVYNGAFNILGLEQIISNDDTSQRRIAADSVMNNRAVEYLLDLAKPKFAIETKKLTSSSVSTEHDFDNVFTLPSDYLTLVELHADAKMDEPITRYLIEGRTLACNYATVYIRFVSSTPGLVTSNWTPNFQLLLSAYIADQIKHRFIVTEDTGHLQAIANTFKIRLQETIEIEGVKESKRPTRATATLTNEWRYIYNDALQILGLDEIVSNDDESNRRVKLDIARDSGVVRSTFEDIEWLFPITSYKLTYNPSYEPDWGYTRVFDKPDDFLRFGGIFQDEYFHRPLKRYEDQDDKWFCDLDEIYIKYVPTDMLDTPSSWPTYFKRLVAARLACQAGRALRNEGADIENALYEKEIREDEAQSTDAMNSPPQQIKHGSWVQSKRDQHYRDHQDFSAS